ncbi:DEAD/DEAH box helicase family protein, putative [Babesia bigemina]|uniref:ATP-dependent RNA helicase n=1 Tax=Babesia bigemina TaxID=5866 RepID=A0A061D225_BABBI|nr:DEAD/DEAH box helicase family protein, putative [Babesia bigemina]CDR94172.1 DEAD/DEAH box helicase family protein, putative [Babesia bigemina]|eukprot:XP_012766358.1 DEAD/DEAH box helicase family protein, putative [Babesia bigemina]
MENRKPAEDEVELTSETFEDLDIDYRAKKVLKDKGYTYLTHVQSRVLPLALAGKNLIIQSPTGSGKTLCFLLPAVKLLFDDGYNGNFPSDVSMLGCICLASTRELATQSAIQMNDLARPLGLKSGCCIGGIRDKYDKSNARRLQILTGTPGRVLSLLSNDALSYTSNVKLLVLDEADRLLDSGFRNDILDIVSYLPPSTQILLFSATIRSSLQDLCDYLLRGKEYEYVCLGSDAALLSASKLRQDYIVVPMSLKLPALFHLLSKHQQKRFIVFLATCKQVRFVYETFKRLIPAVPMTEWHGKQSQLKRNEQFTRFAAKQNYGCIFTTDVGARGVDFPAVDYVVQLDIPDSVSTYTHRVGRTGRLTVEGTRSFGCAFTIFCENETPLVDELKAAGVKLHNFTKLLWPFLLRKENYVLQKLQSMLAKEAWLKEAAQRAVTAYMRYLTTRKSVTLSGHALVEAVKQMALASGLPTAPHIEVEDDSPTEKVSKLSKLKEKIRAKKRENAAKERLSAGDGHVSSEPASSSGPRADVNRSSQKVAQHKAAPSETDSDSDTSEAGSNESSGDDSPVDSDGSDVDELSEDGSPVAGSDGQSGSGSDAADNTGELLKRGSDERVEEDLRLYEERRAAEDREDIRLKSALASTRKKLRLNRHGVAKIRGVETIRQSGQKHTMFDADSDEEEGTRYEAAPPALDDMLREKETYIKSLSERLKAAKKDDHEWEARRRAERRAKRLK